MEPRERLEKLRRLKELRQKAGTPVPVQEPQDYSSRFIADPTKQTGFETQLQGTAAGVASIVEPAMSSVGGFISEAMPDEAKQYMSDKAQSLMQTSGGQYAIKLLQKGGEEWAQFEREQPRAAMDVKAAASVVGLSSGAGGMGYRAGKKMMREALDDSVKPYMNQANVGEMINDGRLKAGKLQKFKFVETDAVKSQKRALSTVKGIVPMQTNIKRFGLVNDEIISASKILDSNLGALAKSGKGMIGKYKLNQSISIKRIKDRFNKGRELSEQLDDAEALIIQNDLKHRLTSMRADGAVGVGDVHKARKRLDHRYRNKKNENRFGGKNETRDERIWKIKRDLMNEIVDKTAPASKAERARIKSLYDVREILHQKATKGQIYLYKDITDKIPLIGDSKVKITPTTGK